MVEEKMSLPESKPTATLNQYLLMIGLIAGLVFVGILISRVFQPASLNISGDLITAETLAEQYGVRVNLIAVTAAGGLVDLRLKILDAEKASLLLQDSDDVPTLLVGDGDALLTAPEDSSGQLLNNLMDDGNIFLTYPNLGNVVKPGMVISIQFGDVSLEPMPVK
jgi:hypothetical protein